MTQTTFTMLGLALTASLAGLLAIPQDEGTQGSPRDASAVLDDLLEGWSEDSRKAASAMLEQYGAPDGVTDHLLVWESNGPWLRTIVHREPVQHDFPKPHKDVLEQFVGYGVPADQFDELAEYDGSVVCQRTAGIISARCDKEPMNFLALNLAHDIVSGDKSVQEARRYYADAVEQFMKGEEDPYTKRLQFPPQPNAGDPDEPAGGAK